MAEIIVTNENYIDEVINSDIPVLLDFWATWCGPCRMIAPIVEEIAAENVGKIKVGKVNVDEQEELAVMFSISAIPTLVVMKDGEVVNKIVGIKPKEDILKLFLTFIF